MNAVRKRQAVLNKFLTKTYHMIDTAPDGIAGWSTGGTSFTVHDISRFEKDCLPKYFNHGKFTSFIRQLNFYGFQKLRSDADLQVRTESVRFAHEYFQKGQPDLLHKITRTTANKNQAPPQQQQQQQQGDVVASTSTLFPTTVPSHNTDGGRELQESKRQIELLQNQVQTLQAQVSNIQESVDERLKQTALALTESYMIHVRKLEGSYDRLLNGLMQQLSGVGTTSAMTRVTSPVLTTMTASATTVSPSVTSSPTISSSVSTLPMPHPSLSMLPLSVGGGGRAGGTGPSPALAAIVGLEKLRNS